MLFCFFGACSRLMQPPTGCGDGTIELSQMLNKCECVRATICNVQLYHGGDGTALPSPLSTIALVWYGPCEEPAVCDRVSHCGTTAGGSLSSLSRCPVIQVPVCQRAAVAQVLQPRSAAGVDVRARMSRRDCKLGWCMRSLESAIGVRDGLEGNDATPGTSLLGLRCLRLCGGAAVDSMPCGPS